MKKICIVLDSIYQSGGIPRVVSMISNELSKHNTITLLSLEKKSKQLYYYLDKRIKNDILFDQINNYRTQFFKISLKLKTYFSINSFDDVIIAGMDYPLFVLLSLTKFKNTKLIGWEHANYTIGKKYGFKWFGRKVCLKYFDKIVVLTDRDLSLYKENENSNKVFRIYNPISIVKETNMYNSNAKKIISAGACISQKGFDYAIMIAKLIKNKYPEWVWDVYGDGEQKEELMAMAKKENVDSFINFKGYANQLTDLYNKYSIFALTSRYEGFGMVCLEAALNKLPIVAFDVNCGPAEIITNNCNGFLIQPYNIEMFAKKISELIENIELREKFSNTKNSNLEKLSIEKIIKEWEQVL